jgi:hypothetical protein
MPTQRGLVLSSRSNHLRIFHGTADETTGPRLEILVSAESGCRCTAGLKVKRRKGEGDDEIKTRPSSLDERDFETSSLGGQGTDRLATGRDMGWRIPPQRTAQDRCVDEHRAAPIAGPDGSLVGNKRTRDGDNNGHKATIFAGQQNSVTDVGWCPIRVWTVESFGPKTGGGESSLFFASLRHAPNEPSHAAGSV